MGALKSGCVLKRKKNQTQHFIKFGPPDARSAQSDKSTAAPVALLARDKRVLEGTERRVLLLSREIHQTCLALRRLARHTNTSFTFLTNPLRPLPFGSTAFFRKRARFSKEMQRLEPNLALALFHPSAPISSPISNPLQPPLQEARSPCSSPPRSPLTYRSFQSTKQRNGADAQSGEADIPACHHRPHVPFYNICNFTAVIQLVVFVLFCFTSFLDTVSGQSESLTAFPHVIFSDNF